MRFILYIITNLSVMAVILAVVHIFGLNLYITESGLDLYALAIFSLVLGFSGSIISLLLSKTMAKWTMKVQIIKNPNNDTEKWLVAEVKKLTNNANLSMPEVGIFEGAPNAFATGASRNSSLVAVSTGLLQSMNEQEVRAVLAHEVAHIENGDMVTMALLQGILNTFVIFLSRVIAFMVSAAMRGNRQINYLSFRLIAIVLDIVLGILAHIIAAYFSRKREFRADAGAVKLMNNNSQPMIAALKRLQAPNIIGNELPSSVKAMGISGGIGNLFATHPPLEQRIDALKKSSGIF